ncbi:MAG TPA: SGNH/GDSL hydrolase family protein, partial [Bryobacteraceae bacterium]|nr:SGNH/GDSL hydrolase family protein [Bryobacteraceae bacterium]
SQRDQPLKMQYLGTHMLPILLAAVTLSWIPPQDPRFDTHGLPWLAENKGELIRLPTRLKDQLPPAVWSLGNSPSGGRIRFRTDSTRVAIQLAYPSPPNMANMHAFGQTGVDLYVDGVYRSTAIAPKDATPGTPVEHVFFENLPRQERELTIYLPLYKPVRVLGIGLDSDAKVSKARRFAVSKPVVFYGTSITQGGCASRSGLSYQAILGRQLNIDYVNLGFSGNGKGEPVVAGMVAEIDASAFVLDFSQNNPTVESLREVYEPFLTTLRSKYPKTPIIAITAITSSRETPRLDQMRQHVSDVVKRRIAAGDRLLTLVEGPALLGPDRLDGLVDGVHPNDLGFQWMADGLAPHVANVLALPPPVLVDDRTISTSLDNAKQKRQEIIRYIWGEAGFPRTKPAAIEKNAASPVKDLKNAAGVETFTIRMDADQENTTHHFIPKRKNGRLVVLQHGHACTFDDAQDPRGYGMASAIDTLLGEGYGVLAAYMPHMRPGDCRTVPHGQMFDLALKSGSQLKFFLEPVAISLNELKGRYKEIHMAGLSGGGWTTTLYAAVDPSIRLSFPVAGSIPLYLRTGSSVGDKEQYLEEFYSFAGYPDLYLLGTDRPGRRQIQILNRHDDCCFGEAQHKTARTGLAYEPAMRVYEKKVQQAAGSPGRFRLEIDDSSPRHMISGNAVQIMLREMQQAR